MRRALDLAREGWGQTAPNPMVGAVVIRGGAVVGAGFHALYGGAHAESIALLAAGDRARGSTLYVTLEPCAHHGKTPPCTDAIIAAGVTRVVAAVPDPDLAAAGGAERLRAAGIAVEFGDGERAARELNAPFFHARTNAGRPFVTLKLALSLDGAIARAHGGPARLTGPEAQREVHRLRAGHDAIAVGVGTVLADDPRLTVREWQTPRVPPLRVVFDSTLRTPPDAALVRTARQSPVVLIASAPHPERARVLEAAGVDIITAASVSEGLTALWGRGVRALMLEGGARLAAGFLTNAVVDRLIIFQAPVVLGAGALNAFAFAPPAAVEQPNRLPVLDRQNFGDDVMTKYALGANSCLPG